MIASAVIVLPEPDSPTSPSVSSFASESETAFTACTVRLRILSSTLNPRRSISESGPDSARSRDVTAVCSTLNCP